MTLLANRALSLAEVASALGFAETSAFCRAFKRWTGQRPAIAALKSGSPGVVV